ncbi:hypothetical protein BDV59DRAFT_40733 [Aspergillus ambiguus]|uniref:uncharacterized protein n=1 Tax=Aspergillus ambiguus TaxID=176160 RepID=UPI003CCD87F9
MTTDGNTSRLHRIVSNHNDALDILFHIVSPENRDTNRQSIRATANQALPQDADPHPEVLRMWNACRFVKMGWFTAREAITLVDLFVPHLLLFRKFLTYACSFFRRIAPYTPIVTDFYSYHSNHYWLITQEPTLCCVILLISSRHDVLAKAGGSSRGHSIHNRLWQHCQHLILRIMLGQEKLSKAKTRHIGSIEALLLLAEWYPRALHFPPENDGWDSDLILTVPDKRDPPATSEETVTLKDRWREDVIEPTRRTDRMAWMVLSSALALSHELDVFRPKPESMYQSKDEGTMPSSSKSNTQSQNSNANSTTVLGPGLDVDIYLKHLERRRRRLPPLLLVYVNLLAARIGCTSPMATILPPEVWERLIDSAEDLEWVRFMASWVELTRLAKGIADQYFPLVSMSAEQRQHTKSLDRWRDCLADWQDRRPRLLQGIDSLPAEPALSRRG